MFTDGIAQSGLCDVFDGCLIFLNFQCSLLHIPNRPVDNGIHIDRDGIFGQRLFRFECTDTYPLVDVGRHTVENRDNHERAGTFQSAKLSHA